MIHVALLCAAFVAFAATAQQPSPEVMEKSLDIASEKFVRKSAVDFQKMLKKGVNNLEIKLDKVLVDWREKEKNFDIVVGEKRKSFRFTRLKTWEDLKKISGKVFAFVYSRADKDDKKDGKIEYALANGMLSKMDRHSRVITPREYKEFIVETEGSFTGLGIVISTHKGWITVISPIEDTPAYRAGMKSGDKIVQIENESTVNMSIIEAVNRLRGPKGEPVTIRILRDSMEKPKLLTIVRDVIKVESVEDHFFNDGILYIKIKNFQRNTTDSIVEALVKRKEQRRLAGIILDLRDNPGGLLRQAAKISDLFLKHGTVFSFKSGENVNPRPASGQSRLELREKTVVLVNSGSASASEIVTGALKENDRALIMGTKTFGKGSIQDIFELDNGSAFKLTIANYLIPGGISIHNIGITPDIFIEEVDFSKDKSIYKTSEFAFLLEKYRKEKEADDNDEDTREPENPSYAFKILNESLTKKDDEEDEIPKTLSEREKKEKREKDPLIKAARRIITGSEGAYSDRSQMLETAGGIIAEIGDEENGRISKKLRKFKVDWSDSVKPEDGKPVIEAKIKPDGGVFKAGEKAEIRVEVENVGDAPVYKLTAVTNSENPLLDGREFIFGKIAPGKKAKWGTKLKIPKWAQTRNDECVIRFFDSTGEEIMSKTFMVGTERRNRPAISYNYEIVDDGRFGSKGNGDGRITKDETVALLFRIQNTGKGKAEEIGFYLKNKSGKNLFLEKAIEEAGEMAAGEARDVVMKFRIEDDPEEDGKENSYAEFELIANDFEIGFSSNYEIKIPVYEPAEFSKHKGTVRTRRNTSILGGSFERAQSVSLARAGSSYRVAGSTGEWTKVNLAKDRAGWIKTENTTPASGKARPDFSYTLASPPVIELEPYLLVTENEKIEIKGSVKDMESVVNISFFKEDDKIHIINSEGKSQSFALNIPLESGMNKLIITAKDSNNLRSARTFYIRKKVEKHKNNS